jgi:hypothetical protein
MIGLLFCIEAETVGLVRRATRPLPMLRRRLLEEANIVGDAGDKGVK